MKKLVLVVVFISLAGCASGVQKLRNIDPGMTSRDVDSAMGRRDSFKSVMKDGSEYTLYQYTNQYCNAHVSMLEKCDFFVIFKDGKVVETGVKNVRSNNPNMMFIYLFQ